MPPKGYKKKQQQEEKEIKSTPVPESPQKTKTIEVVMPPQEVPKPEPAPIVHSIKDDRPYAKVVIVYRDYKGREKTTQYVVEGLTLQEEVHEKYSETGKKQTSIHMSLDCDVVEKN